MNLILKLKKILANRSNPDELTRKRKLHNSGDCWKNQAGYNCKGSNDFKECGE
jgi:hypothetical protein